MRNTASLGPDGGGVDDADDDDDDAGTRARSDT
jgi:hypothetical protein